MPELATTIKLIEQMTAPIMSINNAINNLVSGFANIEGASNINKAFFNQMQNQISMVNLAAGQLNQTCQSIGEGINQNTQKQNGFNDSINKGGSAADGLTKKISSAVDKLKDKIGSAVMAYVSIKGVKNVLGLSDELTQTSTKLALINDGIQTTNELQDKIYLAAQRSRGEYQLMADNVSKMGLAAGEVFSNNDELIAFTEQLNKQFIIAGTNTDGIKSSMLQLTQAMGSGVLRGDELNSIFKQAPAVIQTIADYMDIPIGQIQALAQEGKITADIVKCAILSAAEETNAKFEQIPIVERSSMPMTFGQIATSIKNQALIMFQPLLEKLNEIANSPEFQDFITNAVNVLSTVAGVITEIFAFIVSAAQVASDNWSLLEPIIWGIVGALTVLKAITLTHAAATWLLTASNWELIAANWKLIASILANPLTWIVVLIGVVIAAIVSWVNNVGGLHIAWLIAFDKILTAWDWVKIGFFTGIYWVLDLWDNMKLGIMSAVVSISDFMGDMKTNVLTTLQSMVNGAIDIINKFINSMNKIPGVNIGLIEQVSFGTQAQLQNEAEKQARQADLANAKIEIESLIAGRAEALDAMKSDALAAKTERLAVIEEEQAATMEQIYVPREKDEGVQNAPEPTFTIPPNELTGIVDGVKNIDINTNDGALLRTKGQLDYSEEELKFWRDTAERETINRFTTAEVSVNLGGVTNNVSKTMDLDGIVSYLEEKVSETLGAVAEGAHF